MVRPPRGRATFYAESTFGSFANIYQNTYPMPETYPILLSVAENTVVNRGEKVLTLFRFPFLDFDSIEILPTYFLCQLLDTEFPPDKHMIYKLQSSQANRKSLRDTVLETNSSFRYSFWWEWKWK